MDVCFGNSVHDLAMLEIARHPFAVNPNPDLEKIAAGKKLARALAGGDDAEITQLIF